MLTARADHEPSYRRAQARRSALVAVLVGLVAAIVAVAGPAQAGAAVLESGALTQPSPLGCIGEPTSPEEILKSEEAEGVKCAGQVPFGLSFAYQIQVSPDEKNAYSVAVNGDLIEYSRNSANGALAVIGCFSSGPSAEPCATGAAEPNAHMEVPAIASPAGLVVSPDGKSVYVITQGASNSVVEFSRDQETGLLIKAGCVTHESVLSECETTEVKGLNVPYGIAISPSGENVYVAGFAEEAVAEFTRNSETGTLTQLASPNECVGGTSSPCETKAIGLKEDIGVAVSPDGQNVYVAAGTRGATGDIAEFARGAEGALEQLPSEEACISEALVAECKEGKHLQGSEDLVVSPDGKNVYANSAATNAVIELKRTAPGGLEELASPNECVSTEALTGCTEVKGTGGDVGVAVSPDGENVYASSEGQNAVAAFARDTEGALAQLAEYPCVTKEASGCEPVGANGLIGLSYARRLTVSPGGTNVYVAGQSAHAIVELARTVKPAVSRVALTHGSPSGGSEVRIKGAGFAEGAKVFFGATESPSVTVNSASSITATSPPKAEGTAAVTVENGVGASAEVSGDEFSYTDRPAVAGVGADAGSELGGTTVTITGSELAGATAVSFGPKPAASFSVESPETITATSPPGSGSVDVTVHTVHGTSAVSAADKFTYVDGSISPQGGLFLEGYCQGLGYRRVTLEREEVGGLGFAYENWACEAVDGAETLIANTGPAPSMANACEHESPGLTVYGYPTDPNSAFAWGCYKVVPPEEEHKGGGEEKSPGEEHKENPAAKISSVVGPVSPVSSPPAVPPPVLAKTGNVAPVSGVVMVKLPGTSKFVPLSTLEQIPFGSVIEATRGTVSVTTAEPNGKAQTGQFFQGEFILRQGPNGLVIAELTGGNFSVCPTARERAHKAGVGGAFAARVGALAGSSAARAAAPYAQKAAASGSHVVRKLWANAHGKFSTKGNYAAGAVQGTEWLTEDLCDGTYIKVTRDKVAVTNLVNHRKVEVKVGHHYLAKAP